MRPRIVAVLDNVFAVCPIQRVADLVIGDRGAVEGSEHIRPNGVGLRLRSVRLAPHPRHTVRLGIRLACIPSACQIKDLERQVSGAVADTFDFALCALRSV